MEYIVLGLLLLKDRTIYQLKSRIEAGLSLMYSASTGSIRAALKKLLAAEMITCAEVKDNGRLKKIYTITDSGRIAFQDWLDRPIGDKSAKNPELAKIYFLGLKKGDKTAQIAAYIEALTAKHELLCAICKEAEAFPVPADGREIFFFQRAAAEYGRDLMAFNIRWYTQLLNEIGSEQK